MIGHLLPKGNPLPRVVDLQFLLWAPVAREGFTLPGLWPPGVLVLSDRLVVNEHGAVFEDLQPGNVALGGPLRDLPRLGVGLTGVHGRGLHASAGRELGLASPDVPALGLFGLG